MAENLLLETVLRPNKHGGSPQIPNHQEENIMSAWDYSGITGISRHEKSILYGYVRSAIAKQNVPEGEKQNSPSGKAKKVYRDDERGPGESSPWFGEARVGRKFTEKGY